MSIAKVEKPWGYELIFANTPSYVGKILHITKDHKLSLQYHNIKTETIYLYSGKMLFQVEDKNKTLIDIILNPGDSYHIPPLTTHRMVAIETCDVFEVSTPHLDDIVRLQDLYGRT